MLLDNQYLSLLAQILYCINEIISQTFYSLVSFLLFSKSKRRFTLVKKGIFSQKSARRMAVLHRGKHIRRGIRQKQAFMKSFESQIVRPILKATRFSVLVLAYLHLVTPLCIICIQAWNPAMPEIESQQLTVTYSPRVLNNMSSKTWHNWRFHGGQHQCSCENAQCFTADQDGPSLQICRYPALCKGKPCFSSWQVELAFENHISHGKYCKLQN